MDKYISVGVIILNYNSSELTIRCAESIFRVCKFKKFRIYIVDNCSTDQSMEKLNDVYGNHEDVEIIQSKVNGGYSYGNNIGLQRAVADGCSYIAIANPDTYLINDAISILVDALEKNNDSSIAGPFLQQPNSMGQFTRIPLNYYSSIWEKGILRKIKRKKTKSMRNHEWDGKSFIKFDGMVAGCFFVVNASDIKRMDYFDDDFFLYYEEDVLAYKMKKIERKSIIDTSAKVYHDHAASTLVRGNGFVYFHYRVSEFLLLCKYANMKTYQRLIIYFRNILWFFVFVLCQKDARKYLKKLLDCYHNIFIGKYEYVNQNKYTDM